MTLTSRRILVLITVTAGVIAAGVLYTIPPTPGGFYPKCVVHSTTGLYCPGCGTTRSLHAILHGRAVEAARQNVLLVLFLPLIVWALARTGWSIWQGRPAWRLTLRPIYNWIILALFVCFAVLRNVPVKPFNLLAPR